LNAPSMSWPRSARTAVAGSSGMA